jgi:hypothetical protein
LLEQTTAGKVSTTQRIQALLKANATLNGTAWIDPLIVEVLEVLDRTPAPAVLRKRRSWQQD